MFNETDKPMVFRDQQINSFCSQMQEAISFKGPNGDTYCDEFIEAVIEEVQERESDLTQARVAIEQYIVSNLAKKPDDVLMMEIHSKAMPIIQEVIDIEVKMYGRPAYIVSAANNDARAYSLAALTSNPIQSIELPQDVAQEVAKYGFTNVIKTVEEAAPTLPDNTEDDINEYRASFFEAISDDTSEQEWMEKFKEEESFTIIDTMLHAVCAYEQVSLFVTKALKQYLKQDKTEKQIKYERECFVPEFEITPGKFIITARNSSLRLFFSALQFTSELKDNFKQYIENNEEKVRKILALKETDEYNKIEIFNQSYEKVIDALVDFSAKYPFTDENFKYICLFLEFSIKELRNHVYLAINDLAAYYEERHFFVSSSNCYLLKEYISSNFKLDEVKAEEDKEETKTETPTEEQNCSDFGIFIE